MPKRYGSYGGGRTRHHSARQAKAYNMGRAYGAAKAGKRIRVPANCQNSFKKGVQAAR